MNTDGIGTNGYGVRLRFGLVLGGARMASKWAPDGVKIGSWLGNCQNIAFKDYFEKRVMLRNFRSFTIFESKFYTYVPSSFIHTLTFCFAVLILLVVVNITSLAGWLGKKNYTPTDNKLNLFLLFLRTFNCCSDWFCTVVSPHVKFGETTMKDSITCYWTVEHITIMLIAVVLITIARITSKNFPDACKQA